MANRIESYSSLPHAEYHYKTEKLENETDGVKVQILKGVEKKTPLKRVAHVIASLAIILFTFGFALASNQIRNFCWKALINPREYKTEVFWHTLPEEVAVAGIKQNGLLLQHADVTFRTVKRIVLEAVKQNGLALEFASDPLREDPEIIEIALKQCPEAKKFVIKKKSSIENSALEIQDNPSKKTEALDPKITVEKPKENEAENPAPLFDCKEQLIAALEKDGLLLKQASKVLQNDKNVVVIAVKQNPMALEFASDELKKDKEVGFYVGYRNQAALRFFTDPFKKDLIELLKALDKCTKEKTPPTDKEIEDLSPAINPLLHVKECIMAIINIVPGIIEKIPLPLKNDKEIIKAGFLQDPVILQFASEQLRSDEKFCLELFTEIPKRYRDEYLQAFFKYISDNLKRNRPFVLALMKLDVNVFEYAKEFQNDKEAVRIVLGKSDNAYHIFSHASQDLKNDKEFVLDLSKQYFIYPYLEEKLKQDEDILLAYSIKNDYFLTDAPKAVADAIRKKLDFVNLLIHNALAFNRLPDTLKVNWFFVQAALKKNGLVWLQLTSPFNQDKTLALEALFQNYMLIEEKTFKEGQLYKDPNFLLDALKQDAQIFEYLPPDLQSDPAFALKVVQINGLLLQKMAVILKKNREIVLKAVENRGEALGFAPDFYKDEEVVLQALKNRYSKALKLVDKKLVNRIFVLKAVQLCGQSIRYAPSILQEDEEIVRTAVQEDPEASEYLSDEVKKRFGIEDVEKLDLF